MASSPSGSRFPTTPSVTFGLNPAARFQDGSPITPEDVIFSFEEQKKADPVRAITYRDVVKVEKTGDREVTFLFARAGNRDLPFLVSQLAVIYPGNIGPA